MIYLMIGENIYNSIWYKIKRLKVTRHWQVLFQWQVTFEEIVPMFKIERDCDIRLHSKNIPLVNFVYDKTILTDKDIAMYDVSN